MNKNETKKEAPKNCKRCPRLVDYRAQNAKAYSDWFNGAVPSFGDEAARLLIIGLAPGVSGANRTGRPFTGDYAGDLLYDTLAQFKLSNNRYDKHADDGLLLKKCMITNAVRCVPPQNKPDASEINQCRIFLQNRIAALTNLQVIICLGKIAHDSTIRAFNLKPSAYPFGHGAKYEIANIHLISSYHCSRYNTNTGRLTPAMFHDIFMHAKTYI